MFSKLADKVSTWAGNPATFLTAFAIIILWAIAGPMFGFSEVWQLVINTATTIITFLMVFLIQNTQNRGDRALHLKLDQLIEAVDKADDKLIGIEDETEDKLDEIKTEIRQRHPQNS